MKIRAFIAVLAVAALSAGSCEEITTRTESTRLTAAITVGGSPFVADGKYLIGDEVTFSATVTDGAGDEVAIGDLTFSSDDPSVVQILDASSGQARFSGVGPTTVSVVIGEPSLQGVSEKLGAAMQVQVTEYEVALALTSTVTSSAVDPANALDGDVLRLVPDVTLDGQPAASAIRSINSSDTNVIDPAAIGAVDQVALVDTGSARLTVRFDEPDIPGSAPLTATIDVTVKDFVVEIDLESLVASSSHLAGGDTLETDSVVFRATVVRGVSDTLKNNTSAGTRWTSSRPGVIEIVNDTIGRFLQADTATVSVTFDDLDLPGEPFARSLRVSTFATTVELTSEYSNDLVSGDTLITDSVTFTVPVILTEDNSTQSGVISRIESSDSSRVSPVDNTVATNRAVFADTGAAWVQVRLSAPTLPQRVLRDSVLLRPTTYVATILEPAVVPVMGDSFDYSVRVVDTWDGAELTSPSVLYASSDPTVIEIVNAATGSSFARDTGSVVVDLKLTDPVLPNDTVRATIPDTISDERFYGTFSSTQGDFGDTVRVMATAVHRFIADSTRVFFPNGASAYVDSLGPNGLRFVVGAGSIVDTLLMVNLLDEDDERRDTVQTRFRFDGLGTIADPFEPNDALPFTDPDTVDLTNKLPFVQLLSIDTTAASPDMDFFWLLNPGPADIIVDIRAETQQDANIDFFVCNGTGGTSTDPPTGYDSGACARPASLNDQGSDLRVEEELGEVLPQGRHVFAFYCAAAATCPPTVPITYRLRIIQQ